MKIENKYIAYVLAGIALVLMVILFIKTNPPVISDSEYLAKIDSLVIHNNELIRQTDSLYLIIETNETKIQQTNIRVQAELNKNRKLRNQIYHYDELRKIINDLDLDLDQLQDWFAEYFRENPKR